LSILNQAKKTASKSQTDGKISIQKATHFIKTIEQQNDTRTRLGPWQSNTIHLKLPSDTD
jgi:hypothetical protein